MSHNDREEIATWGEFVGRLRRTQGQSLRTFCAEHGVDPGNWSKLERGLRAPPRSTETLEEYAGFLGLVEGTSDYTKFFDLASASRGEFPVDLRNDEEIVKHLPALFRTLRSKQAGAEDLDRLIDLMRRH